MIPVEGKGSRINVECSNCKITGSISKKYKKSTSGFLFVCGQNTTKPRTWRRYDDNLCYDCWKELKWEYPEEEEYFEDETWSVAAGFILTDKS